MSILFHGADCEKQVGMEVRILHILRELSLTHCIENMYSAISSHTCVRLKDAQCLCSRVEKNGSPTK